jgi:Flp pilus assembly protein TadD
LVLVFAEQGGLMSKGVGIRPRRLWPGRGLGIGVVAAAMLSAAVLAVAGLDNQLFWDDEANTAIYGRNLLRFGRLTAWDGTNVVGYSYGGALGEDLGRELRIPGLPAYVAAAGLYLFDGTTHDGTRYDPSSFKRLTFAGRLPFVILGVLSIGLLGVWLRRHLGRRFPWYLPPLILALSPAYLLYIRNCRYYALGVALTLLVWAFWAPGSSRGRPLQDSLRARLGWVLRCLGAVLAVWLLISTHYLNAASVLATLPLFFFVPRYRRPRQYKLLGVVYAAAVIYGVYLLATKSPFTAEYVAGGAQPDRWEHFYTNALKFVRDVGTHEFVPWVVVLVFILPWLPLGLRRLRPLARRAWVLVALVLAYALLAGLFTPLDMGKSPVAEIRYVVPLIAVGSVLGGMAVVILWRLHRLLAGGALLLLVGTNFLHLGFLARRVDEQSAWWPPILYRYVQETSHDFQTGNEELIDLLGRLPAGTTIRAWPTVVIYPAMFYVPNLHYCDQLSTNKRIDPKLGRMPDYLFREFPRSDVMLLQPDRNLYLEMRDLESTGKYEARMALSRFWPFLSKPEIPVHFFSYPKSSWQRYPGLIVLVESESPVADDPVLAVDMSDAQAVCRWGVALYRTGDIEAAEARLREAVKIDPRNPEAHYHLGSLLWELEEGDPKEGDWKDAVDHLQAAVDLDPTFAEAQLNLGAALLHLGQTAKAHHHLLEAQRLFPTLPHVYFNLGRLMLVQGAPEEAIKQFQKALELDPTYASAEVELGLICYDRGQLDEAIAHFHRALKSVPYHILAHANLGIALCSRADALEADGQDELGRQTRLEAVAHFGEALSWVPPKYKLAGKIQDLLRLELLKATERVPPDEDLAQTIRKVLEEARGQKALDAAGEQEALDDSQEQ